MKRGSKADEMRAPFIVECPAAGCFDVIGASTLPDMLRGSQKRKP